jgi:ketol-acid reductoisomerase
MDWLYANCSSTAQRGALDWAPKFEEKLIPMIEECYQAVEDETEVKNVIKANSNSQYRKKLDKELDAMASQEIWSVFRQIRALDKETRELSNENNNDKNKNKKDGWDIHHLT